ncbi:hypothetical protein HC026_03050 [Lactobacillus sp. LC28-10]|uniref:Uncharacterized protein n=1 Tax=Secundilactobacillus angelensis TaxID=2722706 RepID=A0ABX1KVG8_9LACO|nr:hypothetical protein [Secundilactobacillus angelensis]MCH5461601.1 hypothetical protein [Secundilactobacillus angelensis]NLR17896.1 hypothetical protein [Secundilactobacillus angelensis]
MATMIWLFSVLISLLVGLTLTVHYVDLLVEELTDLVTVAREFLKNIKKDR